MKTKTLIGAPAIDPADPRCIVTWQSQWLKDPLFAGVEYRNLVHPNRSPENNGEIQNVHTLFRREVDLPAVAVRRARLAITADDCYKLYVNGRFAGLGPAPSYPSHYHYNTWDVTDLLKANALIAIGVHVFYQGMHSLTFVSADNLQGMIAQLEIEFTDGSSMVVVSDETWRCLRCDAFESRQIYGYQTAFSEHIDLRKIPHGWAERGFDDGDWQAPCTGPVPEHYNLSAQPTPPVAVFETVPARIVKKAEGHYFIDFGCQLTGETAFVVSGPAGHVVEIRHGEELDGADTVRFDMRCNCTYQEFCTLSGRREEDLVFYDYKGFRYVEVLNWPEALTVERVRAYERHYPFPERASHFSSSNPLLDEIWTLCRNGVRVGTLDVYLDCPTREKGGFMGDGFVTGTSHLILTGDGRILRKFLTDVANTRHICPGLLSTAPNRINGELAEYSMLWPVLLEFYYRWTGDQAFVEAMIPVLAGQLSYFAGYENDDGLLEDLFAHATRRYSVLVDWPTNLRDDYDDPYLMGDRTEEDDPSGVVNTMVQGFYSCMLQAAGRLAAVAGHDGIRDMVAGKADRLAHAVCTQFRDPATGLFVDRNGSTHSALHANVTPLMAGMLSESDRSQVVALIREKRLRCGVYFSFFVLKALLESGETDLAYDLITSHDLHSWHSMLEAGATTCMEAWAPDLKGNTSWCHPWSSAPIYMVAFEIMGLRPKEPGWKEILFAPHVPAALRSAEMSITTPRGMVSISFTRDFDEDLCAERDGSGGTVVYVLTVPVDCPVMCEFSAEVTDVRIDGICVETCEGVGVRGGTNRLLTEPLSGGKHEIVTGS